MKSTRRPATRHSVTVEIAGEKHVLRSELLPEDTRAIAAHVDSTLRGLPGYQTLEPFRAATLAALSITDELFHAREELRRLREEVAQRTAGLASILEEAGDDDAAKHPRAAPRRG